LANCPCCGAADSDLHRVVTERSLDVIIVSWFCIRCLHKWATAETCPRNCEVCQFSDDHPHGLEGVEEC
jgi:hypothetical protein